MTALAPGLVEDLRAKVAGRVVGPAYGGWDEARLGWNLSVDQRPAIVMEVGVDDVVAAVRVAADHGISDARPVVHRRAAEPRAFARAGLARG